MMKRQNGRWGLGMALALIVSGTALAAEPAEAY